MKQQNAVRNIVPRTVAAGKLAGDLLRFGEQQRETTGGDIHRFLFTLAPSDNPEANDGLFMLTKYMLRAWAGIGDLSRCDAAAIEASRKICDVMGWPHLEV